MTVSGFGSHEAEYELRLLDSPGSIQVGGLVVELLDVAPPMPLGEPPPPSEYRALLLITARR